MVLHDGVMQVVGEVEKRLWRIGGQGRARETLHLFAVGRRPVDDGGAVRRDYRFVEGQQQRPAHTDALEQQRRMRVEGEAPTGEDAHFAVEQLLGDGLPFEQVPQLRFQWQQGVLAFQVRPAAHLHEIGADALAQFRQAFGLLAANAFQQRRAGDKIERQSFIKRRGPGSIGVRWIEEADIDKVERGRIQHLTGGNQPLGGGRKAASRHVGVVAGQGGEGVLHVLPKSGCVEHVIMRMRLE